MWPDQRHASSHFVPPRGAESGLILAGDQGLHAVEVASLSLDGPGWEVDTRPILEQEGLTRRQPGKAFPGQRRQARNRHRSVGDDKRAKRHKLFVPKGELLSYLCRVWSDLVAR